MRTSVKCYIFKSTCTSCINIKANNVATWFFFYVFFLFVFKPLKTGEQDGDKILKIMMENGF